MRHNKKKGLKLGTDASHTKAMKRSLVRALFENDRIKTIDVRAKAIRADVDHVITWAKKGDVASRRLAIATVGDKDIVREVFEKAQQGMWADRNGGYTRIMKLGPRKGDGAEIVIMELVTEPVQPKAKKAAPRPRSPRSRRPPSRSPRPRSRSPRRSPRSRRPPPRRLPPRRRRPSSLGPLTGCSGPGHVPGPFS